MDNTIEKCIEYVNSHTNELAKSVNAEFDTQKEQIKEKLIDEIGNMIYPLPVHYEWYFDEYCSFDHSGELEEKGKINLDQTVMNFLENEYTGEWIASYENGRGKNYVTYGDELSYLTLGIGGIIEHETIKKTLEHEFSVSLSDDDMENIRTSCNEFDEIFDKSYAGDFYFSKNAVAFCGIQNMTLREIYENNKNSNGQR